MSRKTVTHIHLSSIHFGYDENKDPYIHLNNYSPYDSKFDSVWEELFMATQNGIDVRLMIGGAGTAFQKLFSNFNVFYPMLLDLINGKSNIIQGIDLDVEEIVDLSNIEMLITKIKKDLGINFKITMAPVQYSLQNDVPGMGGFIYKDLYSSLLGQDIEYFNCQFYMSFSKNSYDSVVENGYPEEKVVMGMLMGNQAEQNYEEIEKVYQEYGNKFGGVFIWEYSGAPTAWDTKCHQIFHN